MKKEIFNIAIQKEIGSDIPAIFQIEGKLLSENSIVDGVNFIVHRMVMLDKTISNKDWVVAELESGHCVCIGKTQKKAIAEAQKICKKVGTEKVLDTIKNLTKVN